jgi:hypothetical protein
VDRVETQIPVRRFNHCKAADQRLRIHVIHMVDPRTAAQLVVVQLRVEQQPAEIHLVE